MMMMMTMMINIMLMMMMMMTMMINIMVIMMTILLIINLFHLVQNVPPNTKATERSILGAGFIVRAEKIPKPPQHNHVNFSCSLSKPLKL